MARATGETIWWSLFAAGGVAAAMVVPALIFITGIALPFVEYGHVEGVARVGYPAIHHLAASMLGRLLLFVVISLSLLHCAHRMVHTSKDLGLHAAHGLFAVVFYGAALAATAFAGYLACTI